MIPDFIIEKKENANAEAKRLNQAERMKEKNERK